MSLLIKRVPVDFGWPLGHNWPGYIFPEYLTAILCPGCSGTGISPEIRRREQQLWDMINGADNNAVAVTDLNYLISTGLNLSRNVDETVKTMRDHPVIVPTVISRLLDRHCTTHQVTIECSDCLGEGSVDAWSGQLEAVQMWKPTEPPRGSGFQIWNMRDDNTGYPMSPVFDDEKEIISYISDNFDVNDYTAKRMVVKGAAITPGVNYQDEIGARTAANPDATPDTVDDGDSGTFWVTGKQHPDGSVSFVGIDHDTLRSAVSEMENIIWDDGYEPGEDHPYHLYIQKRTAWTRDYYTDPNMVDMSVSDDAETDNDIGVETFWCTGYIDDDGNARLIGVAYNCLTSAVQEMVSILSHEGFDLSDDHEFFFMTQERSPWERYEGVTGR